MKYLEKTFTLRVSECGPDGRWRPGAMMVEMQEAAGQHSAAVSCGREELVQMGLAWVVARMEIQVSRYPAYGEEITIRTFHRPHRHRFFPRYFQIWDGAGNLIAQASSLWLLMDLETRQSVSADRLPVPLPDNSDMAEPIPLPRGGEPVDGPEEITLRRAAYTDLDANGHVNNTRYVDWLCDALGTARMTEMPPERMTIHFNSEIRPGEAVELRLAMGDNRFRMTGLAGGRGAFEIGGALRAPAP